MMKESESFLHYLCAMHLGGSLPRERAINAAHECEYMIIIEQISSLVCFVECNHHCESSFYRTKFTLLYYLLWPLLRSSGACDADYLSSSLSRLLEKLRKKWLFRCCSNWIWTECACHNLLFFFSPCTGEVWFVVCCFIARLLRCAFFIRDSAYNVAIWSERYCNFCEQCELWILILYTQFMKNSQSKMR